MGSNKNDDEDFANRSTGEVILLSLQLYGSFFLFVFSIYIIVRPRFPLIYNFCNSIREYNTELSRDHHGHFRWIWKIFQNSDDVLCENCGLTAVIVVRFLRMGIKIAGVGIFNSIYLIPVNYYGCDVETDVCNIVSGGIERIGIGHLSQGSNSVLATTFAAYVIFGSTMYFIHQEFKWYTTVKHRCLAKARPDNYTVYVAHIPEEYRGDFALSQYFKTIFEPDNVLEAKIVLDIRVLEQKVEYRKKILQKLEHAIAVRELKGSEPWHITISGESVESIPFYIRELETLNNDISEIIGGIDKAKEEERIKNNSATLSSGSLEASTSDLENCEQGSNDPMKNIALAVQDKVFQSMAGLKDIGAKSIDIATNLIMRSEDWKITDSGFVTFTSLTAKNQCVQMIHHSSPFTFQVTDAPLPQHIYWNNVGMSHQQQQVGFLVAQLLTATFCIFWTIPVTFVSSLAEVESLKQALPLLEKVIEAYPWVQSLLEQLNPILIVILKAISPYILAKFCQREGLISQPQLTSSLLSKQCIFMIIQLFFVNAISGSIFDALPRAINKPQTIVSLLAQSVPGQVKSFTQFVIVNVFLSCSLELLRAPKIIKGFLRTFIGPNLTDKERKRVFMGLEPFTEPEELRIRFPLVFSEILLYIMILLVYSCIAPIMSYVMLFAFILLLVTYLNQFIYIYSNAESDEGGDLWPKMIKIMLVAILIAEVTLAGVISIKEVIISSTLMIPLICGTCLFILYLEQQHYRVTLFLPSTLCKLEDSKNNKKLDKSFLKEQYIQPALRVKIEPSPIESESSCSERNEETDDTQQSTLLFREDSIIV